MGITGVLNNSISNHITIPNSQLNNNTQNLNMIQVTPPHNNSSSSRNSNNIRKHEKTSSNNEVDIFAMKRKKSAEGGVAFSEQERSRPSKKGKERESGAMYSYIPQGQGQGVLQQGVGGVTAGRQINKGKRKSPTKLAVDVDCESTWEKLKKTPVTISMAEYLATNKKAAQDVKKGITHLYRRKIKNRVSNGNEVGDPMVINTLRSEGLLDEQEYRRNQGINNISVSSGDSSGEEYDTSEDDSDLYDGDSDGSEYDSDSGDDDYGEEYDDEEDSIVGYPYNPEVMRAAQPSKIMVAIGNELVTAILDSGAAVSVMSKKLADRIGLVIDDDDESVPLMGFHSNGKGVQCKVATDVKVKIGGHVRKEHFCIDESQNNREACLLGRPWIRNHDIRLVNRGSMVIVPIKKGKDFIEVQCVADDPQDEDDNDMVSMTPIYAVQVHCDENDKKVNNKFREENDEGVELKSYQEEVIADEFWHEYNKDEVDEEMPEVFADLVKKYKNCFVEYNGIGRVKGAYHEIKTTSETPIRSKPYRLTLDEEESLKEELDNLLKLDIIRPSDGEWSSPIFFVPKKNGKFRLVVNYIQLNKITVKDSYPLPHIEEVLDSLGGNKCFTTLDAASGFWQIELHPNSIAKSGFVTKYGCYTFSVMPFGLCNAPSSYTRYMTNILREYIGVFLYVFIDDVIVYSPDQETHMKHLELVFEACTKANLRLRLEKCQVAKSSVTYLGHEVGEAGIRPCEANVKKIRELKEPINLEEVRSVLGMTGYFRRFYEEYSARTEPLNRLTKKNTKFVWKQEQQDAFNYLMSTLISPPVLSYPIRSHVKILTCDASYKGLGAILSQSPTGNEENETVISYGSKSINNSQLNYTVTHLEALSIVWAVNRYRYYLSNKVEFIIRTDHAALEFILNSDKPSPKIERWKACLMGYKYRVVYKRGSDNPSDALSRLC
jgi:hypothetical protein